MRPVSRAERIIYIYIAQLGQLFSKFFISFFFLFMKTEILQQQHLFRL